MARSEGAEDLWHFKTQASAARAGVTELCDCSPRDCGYPTRRHGRGSRFRSRTRGVRSKAFDTVTPAKNHNTTVRAELQKGLQPFDPTKGQELFPSYARRWVAKRYRDPNSRRTATSRVECHLVPFFENDQMVSIQPSMAEAWLADMRTKPKLVGTGTYAENTVTLVWDLFASIMKTAHERDEIIPRNPCRKVERPTHVRRQITEDSVWEQEVVDALVELTPSAHRPIPLLAATCGHRQGEAFAVAVEDILSLRKKIIIRHQVARADDGTLYLKPPKGNKVRTVPLSEVTNLALAAHIKEYGTTTVRCTTCCKGKEYRLLFTQHGKLLNRARWNEDVWHPVIEAAGLAGEDDIGLHQLRHFWVSTLIDGGADERKIMAYCGHTSITTTYNTYGHLFNRAHDKARSIIDAAFARTKVREVGGG